MACWCHTCHVLAFSFRGCLYVCRASIEKLILVELFRNVLLSWEITANISLGHLSHTNVYFLMPGEISLRKVFKNSLRKKIFRPEKDEVTSFWKKQRDSVNCALRHMLLGWTVRRIRLVGHVARIGR
jgi:hypothetical protein